MSALTRPCVLAAWERSEAELRRFLRHRLGGEAEADDLLQEVFVRALRADADFCALNNPRAWLFQVARNALIDLHRTRHPQAPLPEELAQPPAEEAAPIDSLSACLPRVLSELSADDRLAITLCDLQGLTQQALAERLGLSLAGAKSRVQRARARLRARLVAACQVQFDETGRVCCHTPRTTGGDGS